MLFRSLQMEAGQRQGRLAVTWGPKALGKALRLQGFEMREGLEWGAVRLDLASSPMLSPARSTFEQSRACKCAPDGSEAQLRNARVQ